MAGLGWYPCSRLFQPAWVGRCEGLLAENMTLEQDFLAVLVCFLSYQHFPLISVLILSSMLFPPQNVVYILVLPFLVHKIFTFYINGVLNCKCPAPGPKA